MVDYLKADNTKSYLLMLKMLYGLMYLTLS